MNAEDVAELHRRVNKEEAMINRLLEEARLRNDRSAELLHMGELNALMGMNFMISAYADDAGVERMDAQQIEEIILDGPGFNYYGIRALRDDEHYSPGDSPRYSYDWDHENDVSTFFSTGLDIGGVCTVGLDSDDDIEEVVSRVSRDYGHRLALIGSDSMEYGEDDNEWILHNNATVLAVWEVE